MHVTSCYWTLTGNMHLTSAELHTFAGKLEGRRGGRERQAPRRDSKRSKDTNLAPTRLEDLGRGEQVFFARAIKGESAGVGSGALCPESTHAFSQMLQFILRNTKSSS